MCSKLIIKTSERRQNDVNDVVLVILLLTSIIDIEQVKVSWVASIHVLPNLLIN